MDAHRLMALPSAMMAALGRLPAVNLHRIFGECQARLAWIAPHLTMQGTYSGHVADAVFQANAAMCQDDAAGCYTTLERLHCIVHADSARPDAEWHTQQCTFIPTRICDLDVFPSNLQYDSGAAIANPHQLPGATEELDIEQLACAQRAWLERTTTAPALICKPQSEEALVRALTSLSTMQEANAPLLTCNGVLAHGLASASRLQLPIGFTFLWGLHYHCIFVIPSSQLVVLVDPIGPCRFLVELMRLLR